jgi:AMMECR1 domain-containing protein
VNKNLAFLILLILLINVSVNQATRTAFGEYISKTAVSTPDFLRNDQGRQGELLRYAREQFLARLSLGTVIAPPSWAKNVQRACFVTFFSGRRVVACCGGFVPRTPNLAREIEENVRQALLLDSRAQGIDRRTAGSVDVLITFPGELRPVACWTVVNTSREGLFVENDRGGVAIVPGEAKTASWAFREAMRRLGEKNPSAVRIFAFSAWSISSRNYH